MRCRMTTLVLVFVSCLLAVGPVSGQHPAPPPAPAVAAGPLQNGLPPRPRRSSPRAVRAQRVRRRRHRSDALARRRPALHGRARVPRPATWSRTTPRPGRAEVLVPAASLVPAGQSSPLADRRLRLVGRSHEAARLHQHEEGLAAEHARRLLGARSIRRHAEETGGHGAGVVADVREVLTGRDAGRVRPAAEPLRRRPRLGRHPAVDDGRRRRRHQRDVGLGERRGVRHPRRLPLEPRQPRHRLLAVQHGRRRALHAHQQHRHVCIPPRRCMPTQSPAR